MKTSAASNRRSLLTLLCAAACLALPVTGVFAASHREAPLTALDHKADITDWYAFVSYDNPNKVTMILNTDPLLEPANGPNYHPFDPEVVYEMKVDNNFDGDEDVKIAPGERERRRRQGGPGQRHHGSDPAVHLPSHGHTLSRCRSHCAGPNRAASICRKLAPFGLALPRASRSK